MEHTGRAEKILAKPLGTILDRGMVPILPCIGWGPSGKPYNVPSDEIALAAAASLGAVKLFIVSPGTAVNAGSLVIPPGIEAGEGGRIIRLTPGEAEAVLELNAPGLSAGTEGLAELALATAASRAGVERVHLVDGREEGAVLRELFSNLGSGTMVYADEYEAIRPLKTQDIPDVLRFMEPLMEQGILIRRSSDDLLEKKADYWVFGIDGRAHASGALHRWDDPSGGQGEIAAVAVDAACADMGLGSRIVRFLVKAAAKEGLRRVFVLTTKTQDWFETLGFTESGVETLPEERKKTYNTERNSKVYALDL
jgi:amino-acid N-acetyltransferase